MFELRKSSSREKALHLFIDLAESLFDANIQFFFDLIEALTAQAAALY